MTGDRPVDLRSDTVTRPTDRMRKAMAEAEVGDAAYGEDPTVNRLQARYAEMVGMEAALFVPSGTMANQIAIRVLTRPGDLVLAGARQHMVANERGAAAMNSGIQFHQMEDSDGTIAAADVRDRIQAGAHHQMPPVAVAIENTHAAASGAFWSLDRLEAVAACGLPVHMDGARLFNAQVASNVSAQHMAAAVTTVSSCMSKGLGAPVGSLLAGPAELIERAGLECTRFGGRMRQAGILAAAGIVALDHHVERLADDHARAKALAEAVAVRWPEAGLRVSDVVTNIVVFRHDNPRMLLDHLAANGVLANSIAPDTVRFVTHLDVDDAGIERVVAALASAP